MKTQDKDKLQNDLFLRACKRKKVERTPIWIMRQAGRYLPEYRAVRKEVDFLTLCKTPQLAAEVTLQPVDLIGVDAAIIFSDILVIPEAMGMNLEIFEGKGPVFERPVETESDINKLIDIDPFIDLDYVLDAISMTKMELKNRVPLIGFSGSPFTLMTYMVEGRSSKNFAKVKNLIYTEPKLAHKLLTKLSKAVTAYLNAQIDAGADAVQIFDTWGGILSPELYLEFSLKYMKEIIAGIKSTHVPVIVFSKGIHHNLKSIVDTGADVIGLDWTMDLGQVRKELKGKVALQGNLDPTVLYSDEKVIKEEVKKVLKSYGEGTGHIFNLGHGILPDIDPAKAKFLVDTVKKESAKYHKDKESK